MPVVTADVADYHADPTGVDDSSGAFEAALAALGAVPGGRLLTIPPGAYLLTRPILVARGGITIRGQGRATRLRPIGYFPAIMIDGSLDITQSVRPDGYGILDPSIAQGPGMSRGFATRAAGGDAPRYFLVAAGTGPSVFGGGWESVRSLTLDVCFGSMPSRGSILGLGSADRPSPIVLNRWVDPSTGIDGFAAWFRLGRDVIPRQLTFGDLSTIDPAKPLRLSLSIDLTSSDGKILCAVPAWINGFNVSVRRGYGTRLLFAGNPGEPTFTPADSWTFRRNVIANFHVGNGSWSDATTGILPTGPRPDVTIHGLCLSSDVPYRSDASGRQVRADGSAPTDAFRYLCGGGRDRDRILGLLNTSASAASQLPSQYVYMYSKPGVNGVATVRWDHGDAGMPVAPGDVTIEDIWIDAPAYAPAGILLGPTGGRPVVLSGVHSTGAIYGLLSTNDGAKYDIYIKQCALTGSEAWIQASSAVVFVDEVPRQYVGRGGIRLSGCYAHVGRVLTGDTTPGAYAIECVADASDYAANYVFDEIDVDNERGPQTPVRIEKHGSIPTYVRIGDVAPGMVDAASPAILLVDEYPGSPAIAPRLIVGNYMGPDGTLCAVPAGPGGKNDWTVVDRSRS